MFLLFVKQPDLEPATSMPATFLFGIDFKPKQKRLEQKVVNF